MADPLPTLTDARRLHPVAMSVALGLALVLGVVQLGIWIPNLAIRPAKVVLDHDTWYLGRIVLGLAAVLAGISAFPGGRYYLVVGIWRQYFVNFPSVVSPLPVVFAALRICFSLAMISVIMAEAIVSRDGLGHYIMFAGQLLATDKVFAGLAVAGLLGLVGYRLIDWAERRLMPWRHSGAGLQV